MSRDRLPLGYAFEPVPYAARRARAAGQLSADQYDLIGFLYGRSDRQVLARREETPHLTLHHLAEGISWKPSIDALSKLLRRTQDDGWFSYRTECRKGKRGGVHVYVFTLCPEPVRGLSEVSSEDLSEVSEGAVPLAERGSGPTQPEPVRGFQHEGHDPMSERGLDVSEVSDRTNPLAKRDSASAPREAVRAPQKGQREDVVSEGGLWVSDSVGEPHSDSTNDDRLLPLVEEPKRADPLDRPWADLAARARNGGQQVRAETGDDGELFWTPEKPLEGEDGILADAQALVEAGIAEWVEEVGQ